MEVLGAPSMVARGAPYDLDDWQRLFLFSRADTDLRRVRRDPARHHRRAGARPAPPGPAMTAPARDAARRAGPARPARSWWSPRRPAPASARPWPRRCLAEGAQVVISDRHERRLAAARDELAAAYGDRVWSLACDVTDEDAGRGADRRARCATFGRIDVMVNNAGLGGTSSVLEMTDEQWLAGARRHADRHVPLHPGRAAPDGRPGPRRSRGQQRLGARLAGAAGPGALRGGEGRA